MNKELKEALGRVIDDLYIFQDFRGIVSSEKDIELIKKALTPPNLEELKQSIIDRLNEKYEVDPSNEDEAWYFVEESYKCGFTENNFYDEIYYYKEGIAPIIQMILPLDLAHDITLYFKLRSEME